MADLHGSGELDPTGRAVGAAFRDLANGLAGAADNIPATTTGARTYWDVVRAELHSAAGAARRAAELLDPADPVHTPGTVHGIRPHRRRLDRDSAYLLDALARDYVAEFGIDGIAGVRGHAADCAAHTGAACDHGCPGSG